MNNFFNKRINIFTGHFGSGKTEVAINFAIKLHEQGHKTAIVDMDIVNPYFRTADLGKYLTSIGILTITPVYANTNVDIPALSGEINTVFDNCEYKVVLDVGGDDVGAKVLSTYKKNILKEDYNMFCVINTKRKSTETVDSIYSMIKEIEHSSGLKLTGLINNTNLLSQTSQDDLDKGQKTIEEVSQKTNIPISFLTAMQKDNAISNISSKSKIFVMNKHILLPWEK